MFRAALNLYFTIAQLLDSSYSYDYRFAYSHDFFTDSHRQRHRLWLEGRYRMFMFRFSLYRIWVCFNLTLSRPCPNFECTHPVRGGVQEYGHGRWVTGRVMMNAGECLTVALGLGLRFGVGLGALPLSSLPPFRLRPVPPWPSACLPFLFLSPFLPLFRVTTPVSSSCLKMF